MRIRRIHMDRYGMFSDTRFDLPSSGLQVLYGVNEAGKSTIMRFIREVLFGFSARAPDISEGEGAYGGRLELDVPGRGMITVERTGAKRKGDVNVYDSEGTTGGEETLAALFPGLDQTMFHAIFSFGLDGLQNLENIKAEELNDYLFHAGMTGDFAIFELEKTLAKKQREWFKPRGSKPELNRKLAELDDLEKDLVALRRQNDGYRELTEQIEGIERRLEENKQIRAARQQDIRSLEKRKTLAPFVKEKAELNMRLEQLPAYEPFPEDGLSRFDHWKTQAVTLASERDELEAAKRAVEEECATVQVNDEWLALQSDVRREREQQQLLENKLTEQTEQEQIVRIENEELAVLMEELGSQWTEQQIEAADTSVHAKESLKEHLQKRDRLEQRWHMQKTEEERLDRIVRENKKEREALAAQRLTDSEREEMEERLKNREAFDNRRSKTARIHRKVLFGWACLSALFILWFAINDQWWVAGGTAILTGLLGIYLRQMSASGKDDEQTGNIAIEGSDDDAEKAKLTLAEDDRLQQREAIAADRLASNEKAYNEMLEQMRQTEQAFIEVNKDIEAWCEAHRFPGGMKPAHITAVFERVEEAKDRIRRRRRAEKTIATIETEKKKRENVVRNLCTAFDIAFEDSAVALARMSDLIDEQIEHRRRLKQLRENARKYAEQIRSLQGKINRFYDECNRLMQQAETEDEEAFRRKGKAWRESRELREKIASVEAKIAALVPDRSEREDMISAVLHGDENEDDVIRRLEEELDELEREDHTLLEQLASLNERKKQLEEGGTYAERLHRFEQKKDECYSVARKWAVYRTAEHLLKKTKERYRNQRLPKVIETASRYFSKMTNHRYVAVYAPENDGLIVERHDGKRLSPNQLSRGTGEQLYLALRLALARIYESPSPYPFIMDDILVNFDADRAEKAVEAIRDVSHFHQVILFTCHTHLLNHFRNEEILFIDQGQDTPLPMF